MKFKTKFAKLSITISLFIIVANLTTGCSDKRIDKLTNTTTSTQQASKYHSNKENKNYLNDKKKEHKYKKSNSDFNSKSDEEINTGDSQINTKRRYVLGKFDYSKDIPKFRNKASIVINNNTPFFPKEKIKKIYKKYQDLDSLNRVGTCEVVTGPEYLPKYKRGDISSVKPTGWRQKKYDFIDGKFLYNRCHLIAHSIAGDNANIKNLMTGTRYFNVEGMLPYENMVSSYIKRTKHHVKYRVTPIFLGNEKVARGVVMEAQSIEDNKLRFNVFCYNVQPRVNIDYNTGYSTLLK